MIEDREPKASGPVMASSTARDARTELPWICEGCGHFMVTRIGSVEVDERPQHDCPVAARTVVFVPYQSSEHAAEINRRRAARELTPRL